MRGNAHVRFGGRAGETDQPKGRHRAPVRPYEGAVVYCVDEKSQVQALARSQPAFPMMPYMPERRTHDYVRHGTTSLSPRSTPTMARSSRACTAGTGRSSSRSS